MRPASHCTLSLHARVSRYWLVIFSSTLDHMIFYTIYNLQCMKTETLKCKTWLTLSLLDSSSWLLLNHVVTGQSVSLIHVRTVKFLHCRADISFRLGSRIIRDRGASLHVHLRTQVRGHHSLLLTSICLLICWFLMVSIPDSQVQKNVWQNISVSLAKGQLNHFGSMLWWNLSAPCRLSGEVWLCGQGNRQQLSNGTWRQNNKGLWVSQLIAYHNLINFTYMC